MTLTKYNAAGEQLQDEARFAPQGVVCKAYLAATTAAQAAGQWVKVPLNAVEFDPFAWFDVVNNRFLPKIAGYYSVKGICDIQNPGGNAALSLYKNGAFYNYLDYGTASAELMRKGSTLVYFNGTTDYVELWSYAAAAAVRYGGTNGATAMSINLVAASVGVAPEPWHLVGNPGEPAFLNGWANYGLPHSQASFFKDPHAIVHLRGMLQAPAAGTGVAFQLPVGYRPAQVEHYGAARGGNAFGKFQVNQDGTVQIILGTASDWFTVSGASFRAEQ